MKDMPIHNHLALKLLTIFCFFQCILFFPSSAQEDPFTQNHVPPAPNAASFGKYGDIPVSYHTGVPSISIPLHTMTEGELSLPISLSYHSAGIKVNETASWVGLGWSLNAGGSITRTVQGTPDEGGTGSFSGKGWYQDENGDVIGKGGLTPLLESQPCTSTPNDGENSGPCFLEYTKALNKQLDTEPDVFSFNINGYSGKFFFDEYRVAHIQPEQDIKIIPNYDLQTKSFVSWLLITPDGTRYHFGEAAATEHAYSDFGAEPSPNDMRKLNSTTWYLYKIENVNRTRFIELCYEDEKYYYTDRPSHSVTFGSGGDPGAVRNISSQLNLSMVLGKKLRYITCSSGLGTASFVSETLRTDLSRGFGFLNEEARSLDRIEIKTGTETREFLFTYDYFESEAEPSGAATVPPSANSHGADTRRLRLLSLQEQARASDSEPFVQKPPHTFDYIDGPGQKLPRRLSLARDYWGYFNGQFGNQGLVFYTPLMDLYANLQPTQLADRDPIESRMKAGVLNRITYPSGGYTEFEYEAHRQSPGATTIFGGLRVKTVTNYAEVDEIATVKSYEYLQGQLYLPDPRTDNGSISFIPWQNNEIANSIGNVAGLGSLIINAEPSSPLIASLGYPVGYSLVEVSTVSPNDPAITNGKTRYSFFNPPYPQLGQFNYPSIPGEFNPIYGKQYQEIQYDDQGEVVQSITNFYETDFVKNIKARRVTKNGAYILYANYDVKIGRTIMDRQMTEIDGVLNLKTYTYSPKHNFPIKETSSYSDGRIFSAETDYNLDLVPDCSQAGIDACELQYQQDVEALLQAAVAQANCDLSTLCYPLTNASSPECLDCYEATYSYYYNNLEALEETYRQCARGAIADYNACIDEAINSVDPENQALGLALKEHWIYPMEKRAFNESFQQSGSRTTYELNEFDHISPAVQTLYEATNATNGSWKPRNRLSFDSQNLVSEQIPDAGQPLTYIWGYGGTRPVASVTNAFDHEVAFTGFERPEKITEVENGGWAINESAVINSYSRSGNMVYPVTGFTGSLAVESHDGSNVLIQIDIQDYPSQSENHCAELCFAFRDFFALYEIQPGTPDFTVSLPPGVYQYNLRNYDCGTMDETGIEDPVELAYSYTNTRLEYDGFANTEGSKTGLGSYILLNGNSVSKDQLPQGQYQLSYWQKNGAASVAVSGGSVLSSQTLDTDANGWELVMTSVSITSANGLVSVEGNGVAIDELRLHPEDSQMSTISYGGNLQVKDMVDPNHVPTTYEYDGLGRLKTVKDLYGNTLQTNAYHYKNE